ITYPSSAQTTRLTHGRGVLPCDEASSPRGRRPYRGPRDETPGPTLGSPDIPWRMELPMNQTTRETTRALERQAAASRRHEVRAQRPSRREFLRAGGLTAGAALMSPAVAEAQALPKAVARNRTLVVVWGGREGRWVDHELWNPYAVGSNHQNGPGVLYEPLAYYSAFADKQYPWLASSHRYSPDARELTIRTRPGIRWSDGAPFGAD